MPDADAAQYLYGVVRAGASPGGLPPGVHERAVTLLVHGGLAAVVSDVDDGAPIGRRRDLTAHHEVLRQLALGVDVAPMQFGLVLPGRDAVRREILEARHDLLLGVLDRLAGSVQMSLRAAHDEPTVLREVVEGSDEVRYLRERTRDLPQGEPHPELIRLGEVVARDLESRCEADRVELLGQLHELGVHVRERDPGAPPRLLDAALLVERSSVSSVEAALERLAADLHPRIQLRLTEPTAPFDFVEEPLWV